MRASSTILIVAGDLPSFANHRLHLVRRLIAEGHDVHLIAGGSADGADDLQQVGVSVEQIVVERQRIRPLADIGLFFRIVGAIRKRDPDIVQVLGLKSIVLVKLAAWLIAGLGKPVNLVISFAGLGRGFADASGLWSRLRRRLLVFVLNLSAGDRLRTVLTTENEDDRRRLLDYGINRSTPIRVIRSTGINLDAYFASDRSGPLTILFAGRLLKEKGAELFLQAVDKLAPRYPNIRFLMAGPIDATDPDSITLDDISVLTGVPGFEYLGVIPMGGMPSVLSQVDVVCLPTTYGEGIPRVLMEAAASSSAYVAMPQSGWVEIVGPTPDSGWLMSRFDLTELERCLEEAIVNPSRTRDMGRRARETLTAAGVSEADVQSGFLDVFRDIRG